MVEWRSLRLLWLVLLSACSRARLEGSELGSDGETGTGGENPREVVEAASGNAHTCVRFDDGGVKCWGSGERGLLGYANLVDVGGDQDPLPRDVDDLELPEIAQLSAGETMTCARSSSGEIYCWGSHFGGLGLGHTEDVGDDETPIEAGPLALGGAALYVAVGDGNSCAVLQNGAIRCWGGWHDLGAIIPSYVGDDETPAEVAPIPFGVPAVGVAVAGAAACALTGTGDVFCWGVYPWLVGYGDGQVVGDDETPAEKGPLDLGGRATSVVAGFEHFCALLDTGSVRCWGRGFPSGAHGYPVEGDIGDDETPNQMGDVDIGGRVIQLAAGASWTCALLESGALRCWGAGEPPLGYGKEVAIGDDEVPASAGDVDVGAPVTGIWGRGFRICATVAGGIRCWGNGTNGPLGYGHDESIGDDELPADVGDVPLQ